MPLQLRRNERPERVEVSVAANVLRITVDQGVSEKRAKLALHRVGRLRAALQRLQIGEQQRLAGHPIDGLVIEILLGIDAMERVAEPAEDMVEQKATIVCERGRIKRTPAGCRRCRAAGVVRRRDRHTGSLGSHATSHK